MIIWDALFYLNIPKNYYEVIGEREGLGDNIIREIALKT